MLNEVQHVGDAEVSLQAKGLVQQVQIVFAEFSQIVYGVSEALQSQTMDIS